MHSDIPEARATVELMDGWIQRLAQPLLPAVRIYNPDGTFQWQFRDRTPSVVLVAKAVRMVSGTRAALLLADASMVTECASILRMTSDFSSEILAIGEGILKGQLTTAQRKFVDQFFVPLPTSVEEYTAREKEAYVGREDLMKSHVRLANESGQDGEAFRDVSRVLNKGYDAYVHGAYETAMELYHGGRNAFLMRPYESAHHASVARATFARKLTEVVVALEFMSLLWKDAVLHAEIRAARRRLEQADE